MVIFLREKMMAVPKFLLDIVRLAHFFKCPVSFGISLKWSSSSSSSCRAASTDISDPLSPLFPIVHRLRQVFRATSRILTELLYCMYVQVGRPAFVRAYVGVHRSTSLMSSSLLLLQFPACPVRLTLIVFVMGGKLPYGWCFVGCCLSDLFNIWNVKTDKIKKLKKKEIQPSMFSNFLHLHEKDYQHNRIRSAIKSFSSQ